MTRGLSVNNLTAIAAAHIRPIVFVKFVFDGGTEYVHNAVGNYTWGGFTWQGVGALGDIGPLEEGLDLSPYGVTMQLNALDADLLDIVNNEPLFNRAVTVYIGYLDENGVLVADPQERWSGFMDFPSIRLGLENRIALQCESDLRFFYRANGSLFTDEDQQLRYSGDLFFQFLPQMIDAQINWNGVTASPGTRRPGRAQGDPDDPPHDTPKYPNYRP